jgi:hypothetical protein
VDRTKTYSELRLLDTFDERFEYLKLVGKVGAETFGYDRIFNQRFYSSYEWLQVRNMVIARDLGCDLGIEGYKLDRGIVIHHMNPIDINDIRKCTEILLNPEFLITTSHATHNAIHYGNSNVLRNKPIERTRNDTCPWKH